MLANLFLSQLILLYLKHLKYVTWSSETKTKKVEFVVVFPFVVEVGGGQSPKNYVIPVALRRLGGFKGSKKIFWDS